MNHRNFRGTMLVMAGTLALAACGSSDSPTQQATAPAQQAAPAAAPAPAPATPAPAAAPAASQPATALQEFIDPVTGQPRAPTDAELKAIAAPTVKPNAVATPAPKKEIVLSNGMVAVEPGVVSTMKACVQQDGRVLTDHDCRSDAAAPVKKP
jgi:hypothetical protein